MGISLEMARIIANDANRDANIMYHMMCAYLITGKYENLNNTLANTFMNCIKEAETFIELHEYVEKIFKCNLFFTPILKEMTKMFTDKQLDKVLEIIYIFLSKDTRNLFSILELFLGFKKIFHDSGDDYSICE